jgi:peptidoglycan/xylan/chitin deacetylase (PgdA/CDA1 family)
VPVLAYHKVDEIPRDARFRSNYVRPHAFAAQLRLLRRSGFQSVSLADYAAYRRGAARLPPRPVIITFDDGYASNRSVAVPVLERYGFRATFFIVTDYIGATNCWDVGERQERLLSRDEILEMHASGFEIQSHTRTHPRLPLLSPALAREELSGSRRALEDIVQAPVTAIAYPWSDYDDRTLDLTRETGYDTGVILRRRTNFSDTPLLEVRRIGVNHETPLARFAWDLLRLRWRGA